jgi:hypothetical protein
MGIAGRREGKESIKHRKPEKYKEKCSLLITFFERAKI